MFNLAEAWCVEFRIRLWLIQLFDVAEMDALDLRFFYGFCSLQWMMLFDCLVVYLFLVLMVMLGVGFFTLLERRFLGYVQVRKGPNRVGVVGLMQPFSDGIKLFIREFGCPDGSNWLMFMLRPIFGFLLSLLIWLVLPFIWHWFNFVYGLLFFFCVSGVGVYFVVGSGWFSNSKYALLGSYRAVAQMISYEVAMILIVIFLVFLESGYCLNVEVGSFFWYGFGYIFLLVMWFVRCVAETNRRPFDFAEAESELVSGFNVEYGRGGFALLFMSEYGNILAVRMVRCLLFFGGVFFFFVVAFLLFLWVRGSLPRMRYDKLMMMVWRVYLPCSLWLLVFCVGLVVVDY
jgi:NADH-ubiquinone oxidoreductase chain 1